ncbi:MAG: glycosyl hydrolase family 28 protein [Clostridia bacterium]
MYKSIKDFGVVGNGILDETYLIQKAIDEVSQTGETLFFPKGVYKTATLFLKNDTHIHLASNALIQSVEDVSLYSDDIEPAVEAPGFTKCLLNAVNVNNISISGSGTIDGMGQLFSKLPRPMLIRFVKCKNIIFRDVHLKNSASWCCHLIECEDINIDAVNLYNHVQHNNDGFDLDSCKNVRISNCNINTQDDSICLKSTTDTLCENITITNCVISSETATFKLGTSSKTGFRNIVMSNCTFTNCIMGTIKLLMVDGGIIENVVISNIVMQDVGSPLFIRLGMRNLKFEKPEEMNHGSIAGNKNGEASGYIRNISISNICANVKADKDRMPIMISGIPSASIEDVRLDNINISFAGLGTEEDRNNFVDEDPYRYPEQGRFGVLPVWGIYARHINNLNISNMELKVIGEDARDISCFKDIKELKVTNSNI